MLKTFTERKRKIIRILLGTLSFSTALFVFQACYGTNKDFGLDTVIKGNVKSSNSNTPLCSIKVSLQNLPQYVFTDKNGEFQIYVPSNKTYTLTFEDTVAGSNLKPIDTVLVVKKQSESINILMNDK